MLYVKMSVKDRMGHGWSWHARRKRQKLKEVKVVVGPYLSKVWLSIRGVMDSRKLTGRLGLGWRGPLVPAGRIEKQRGNCLP